MAEWQIEQLRLTAFPTTPLSTNGLTWWQTLTGEQPESRAIRPREGILSEDGPLPDGLGLQARLSLEASPLRIDWRLQVLATEPDAQIPSWEEGLPKFLDLMEKWLSTSPLVSRLAVGAVLLIPVENIQQGYQELQRYLPFVLSPNSSDFLFQINIPTTSMVVKDLKVNRLSKWSVARIQTLFVPIMLNQPLVRSEGVDILHVCRLELDINNANVAEGLDPKSLPMLMMELARHAKEITLEGVPAE